jgi:hypothetical protein
MAGLATIPAWRVIALWGVALALEFLVLRAVSEPRLAGPTLSFTGDSTAFSKQVSPASRDSAEVLTFAMLVRTPQVQVPGMTRLSRDSVKARLRQLRALNRDSLWRANNLPARLDAAQHDSLLRAFGAMLTPVAARIGAALDRAERDLIWLLIEILAVPVVLLLFTGAWLVARHRARPSAAAA